MSQYNVSIIAAVRALVRSPSLASNVAVSLVTVVCPSAIRTCVGCPFWGMPCVCAMFGLTYDLCACESSSAVTKPDLNSSSTAGVGILSERVRVTFIDVGCVAWRGSWFSTTKSVSLVAVCTAITKASVSVTSVLRVHFDGARVHFVVVVVVCGGDLLLIEIFCVGTGDICEDAERVNVRLMVISPSVLTNIVCEDLFVRAWVVEAAV
ncbi:Uncharacterized protein FWK35_00022553 [Aphis craccivora]|uniref:Uncharacterized protein n=1 Tax=Aphis craccivora TaxID=307492 RepID=A0A6G0Y0H3_APHCR|nr:Uncharacterized protein FWK35_00022553 [Aphis craccivora]